MFTWCINSCCVREGLKVMILEKAVAGKGVVTVVGYSTKPLQERRS